MAEITSGTINFAHAGDLLIGSLELINTADDGDTVNLGHANFLGSKVAGVLYAAGVGDADLTSGTAFYSPIGFSAGTASIELNNSGSSAFIGESKSVSNKSRHIFFVARSTTA